MAGRVRRNPYTDTHTHTYKRSSTRGIIDECLESDRSKPVRDREREEERKHCASVAFRKTERERKARSSLFNKLNLIVRESEIVIYTR